MEIRQLELVLFPEGQGLFPYLKMRLASVWSFWRWLCVGFSAALFFGARSPYGLVVLAWLLVALVVVFIRKFCFRRQKQGAFRSND